MKLRTAFVSLFVVAVSAVIVLMAVSRQGHSTVSAATSSEAAALNDALKNGLITEDEYDAKLEAMAAADPQSKPHSARAAATPAGISTRLKTVEIQDPAWGITAFRMQIPEDWRFEGVLIRDQGCGLPPTVAFRATSPDGLYGAQMMPQFGSFWSDEPSLLQNYRRFHCKIEKPMDAEAFMKFILPLARPNPTAGPIEPTVDAQQWQQNITTFNQRAGSGIAPAHMTGGAIRSRINYTWKGVPMEENFTVRISTTQQSIGMYGGPKRYSWTTAAYVAGFRSPKGNFDEANARIAPLLGKAAYTDEWTQRSMQKQQRDAELEMASIRRQGEETRATLAQNHQDYMQAQQASYQKHNQQWREHIETMDRSAKAYELYASDEQLVRNPQTGGVTQVTNQYGNNGWQDQGGTQILMTNDPNLNPNLYLRGTWTQLENVNPLQP
jgi:hypothetical protein